MLFSLGVMSLAGKRDRKVCDVLSLIIGNKRLQVAYTRACKSTVVYCSFSTKEKKTEKSVLLTLALHCDSHDVRLCM